MGQPLDLKVTIASFIHAPTCSWTRLIVASTHLSSIPSFTSSSSPVCIHTHTNTIHNERRHHYQAPPVQPSVGFRRPYPQGVGHPHHPVRSVVELSMQWTALMVATGKRVTPRASLVSAAALEVENRADNSHLPVCLRRDEGRGAGGVVIAVCLGKGWRLLSVSPSILCTARPARALRIYLRSPARSPLLVASRTAVKHLPPASSPFPVLLRTPTDTQPRRAWRRHFLLRHDLLRPRDLPHCPHRPARRRPLRAVSF